MAGISTCSADGAFSVQQWNGPIDCSEDCSEDAQRYSEVLGHSKRIGDGGFCLCKKQEMNGSDVEGLKVMSGANCYL